MNLVKAKEILESMVDWTGLSPESDSVKAIKLGIKALQRELDNQSGSKYVIVKPLEGQTED